MPTTVPGIAKRQHRHEFEGALAGETLPVEEIGDQQSERRGERSRDRGDGQRRREGAPGAAGPEQCAVGDFGAERRHVVAQRQRVVEPPFLEESAREDHRVDDDASATQGSDEAGGDARRRARQRQAKRALPLAGNRDEAASREQPPLDDEERERQGRAARSRGWPPGRDPAARRRSRSRSRPTALRGCRPAAADCRNRRGFR